MKLKDIKPNPNNPRVLRDDKFQKLKQSITEFNVPGVRTYKNELQLIHLFTKALEKDDAYFVDLEAGRKWLREERDLVKVNELRLNVLNAL